MIALSVVDSPPSRLQEEGIALAWEAARMDAAEKPSSKPAKGSALGNKRHGAQGASTPRLQGGGGGGSRHERSVAGGADMIDSKFAGVPEPPMRAAGSETPDTIVAAPPGPPDFNGEDAIIARHPDVIPPSFYPSFYPSLSPSHPSACYMASRIRLTLYPNP
jgi:hypothetical protein